MKLASLKSGRDGRLCVVARDLSRAVEVPHIAPTLQQAIDNWDAVAEELGLVSDRLNAGHAPEAFDLDPTQLAAPLPRAYQWADGSAYVNHVELVRKARGAEMPESFWTDPLMYQGGSDGFIGPRDDILAGDETWGIDFESEVAVITDDVPMGTDVRNAGSHIKLLMLVNDVSLRNLIPGELAKGFGFFHGKPASAFSPVAVTPDELGDAWDGAKVNLPLITDYNGKRFGSPDAGTDMTFNFCDLVAHAAISRTLGAGTVIGSGTVSNLDRSKGSSCLAEIRMLETIDAGAPVTPFMQFSDSVR
ncbi:MAG: fumarylacetoacetate hydrolase family protein, partial [Alphaproteobacteria bacterium]|nr:fumarylacetoacetate hydrolase family protein [Alphaproteobacteria bacterium]